MGQPAYDRNAVRRRRAPQPQRKANLRVAKGGKRRLNPLQAAVHNAMNLVAAALLIGVVSGIGFSIWSNGDAQDQMLCEVVVPEGSRTSLTLPDSSTVWLNSGSRLSYTKDFGRKNRNISLCGEGFFDVRRDESHPFVGMHVRRQ